MNIHSLTFIIIEYSFNNEVKMSIFPVLTKDSVSTDSSKHLQQTLSKFGFIPNLLGVMANSSTAIDAYLSISNIFSKSSFSATEQQIILLTVSYYHNCNYCMAAHSAISDMQDVDSSVVYAIRNNQPIVDEKLESLRNLTWQLVDKRGWINENDLQNFLNSGYEPNQVLEILVGISQKILSNFTNHLANTPLDENFSNYIWASDQ